MNLRLALRWIWARRVRAAEARTDMFDQRDPEPLEDVVDWLFGNDDDITHRASERRRELAVGAGGEVG